MKTLFITGLRILGIMTLLLGIVYPLLITGITQVCFHKEANGSLIKENGKIVGSYLIGQQFDDDGYFTSRPSATGYGTLSSSASNLGLTSRRLYETAMERQHVFITRNNLASTDSIPSEMIFASASGLDPHISLKAAMLQINRIAETRRLSAQQKQQLQSLVQAMSEKPQFNLLGESRVNVLALNLQLNKDFKRAETK